MAGLGFRRPFAAQITQARLNALDIEPDGGAAGEGEENLAGGRFALFKDDGEQIEYAVLLGQIETLGMSGQHMIEMETRAAARTPAAPVRLFPYIAVEQEDEAPVGLRITHVANLEDGILSHGGNDGEVLGIEGEKPEIGGNSIGHISVAPDREAGLSACRTSGHGGAGLQVPHLLEEIGVRGEGK